MILTTIPICSLSSFSPSNQSLRVDDRFRQQLMKQPSRKAISPFQIIESLVSFNFLIKISLDYLLKHSVRENTNETTTPAQAVIKGDKSCKKVFSFSYLIVCFSNIYKNVSSDLKHIIKELPKIHRSSGLYFVKFTKFHISLNTISTIAGSLKLQRLRHEMSCMLINKRIVFPPEFFQAIWMLVWITQIRTVALEILVTVSITSSTDKPLPSCFGM